MHRDFTPYQQQAIATDGRNICVAAGAGSGKTGVLVERFVRLLTQSRQNALPPEQRAGVENILVITFTERATKEMKTRIVAELNRLGLTEERRQVETAYISTIHGFCSRLLQENPFEAGVDPQFKVLDESQAKRLLRQTFDEVIRQAYAENDTGITELVAAAHTVRVRGEEIGEPLAALASAAETMLAQLRGAGRSREELERHWQLGRDATAAQSLEPVWSLLTPLLIEIRACAQGLHRLRAGMLGAAEVAYRALVARAACLRPRAASVTETLLAMEELYTALGKAPLRQTDFTGPAVERARLFTRIKNACQEAKALFGVTAAREEMAAQQCHQMLGLVLSLWKAYDRAKHSLGRLDSDDLQAEGVRLLESFDSVRRRYQARFRHLLVDEFQDTNPLQMRLIERLHVTERDCETPHAPAPNFLFVVGDVQQSIYGFRSAEPTLFQALERQYRQGAAGTHIPLAVNFRSRPEILRLVELIFARVWQDEATPFVPLTPGADFDPKSSPSLEILLTRDLSRRDYVALEAEALAARIQQMVEKQELQITSHLDPRRGEPITYRDVAVLLRSLTDIQKYEEAFARRGVPYFVVGGGRGYYARREIRDLLNVLTVLDTPLDDVALAATLRSPLFGVDTDTLYALSMQASRYSGVQEGLPFDPATNAIQSPKSKIQNSRGPLYTAIHPLLETRTLPPEETAKLESFLETIETLRAQEDRLPVGHLLERLIARTGCDARLLCRPGGRRRLANVRKLLQMANADSVLGVREFIRRLRDLEKLSDREGDAPTEEEAANVARILTIHSAKGLEFPVVILADLSRGLLVPERGLFVCEPQAMALGTKLGGEPNLGYRAIVQQREAADKQEANRLLYVAMTRAREHLILCGNTGRNRGLNWADLLFPLLGVQEPPSQPGTQTLAGGLEVFVAALSHYLSAPEGGIPGLSDTARQRDARSADELARALLQMATKDT